MSDINGASDLDNDTPGLGPPTGNARGAPGQLPSALQGIASRIFGQGRPNPKFLPPKPQQAQLGSTDGPADPDARSLAPVPSNAPRTPPKFTPYTQPIPRDHGEWGQPEAFPRLPQSFEVNGMYQQLGGYFAQHGGFASAPLGAGLSAYSKAYNDAYQKGMDFKMKMAKEQIAMHSAQLAELEDARTFEYADIFTRNQIEGTDPHDDLWASAVKHGDQDVIRMMENGDSAEKVRRFLSLHESHIRALKAANAKQTEEDAAAELYGLKPRGGEGGAYDPYTNPTGSTAAGAAAPPAPSPAGQVAGPGAPSEKDARAPGVGDPLEPDKPKDKGEDADDIADPDQKRLHDAARDIFKGNEPKDVPKTVLPYAGIAARDMRDTANDILRDAKAGKIAPDKIAGEVRKRLGGDVANDLDDILNYRTPGVGGGGQGGGTGGKEADYKTLLGSIAAQIDRGDPAKGKGGWTAANYQAQERFRTDVNTQTVILRSNSLAADGNAVLADLKELERQGRPTTGLDLDQIVKNFARDPLYAKLSGDWLAYNDAFNSVVTGGRHVESGAMAQVHVAPTSFASPAAFRAAIKGHMNDALGYLEGEHTRWETIGGKETNMPSYNPKTEKELRDMRDMDYLTGTFPGEPHTNKKGVTKIWSPQPGNLNPYDAANWK